MSNLNPDQFGGVPTRHKVSDSPSGYPARVERIPVANLLPLADPSRVTDKYSRAHVESIAAGLRERGFDAKKHHGFDHWGTQGYSDNAQPIHLVHESDGYSHLFNGNHRVHAASMAGLKDVPVLVTDMRAKRKGAK